jgi:hypothetical protein
MHDFGVAVAVEAARQVPVVAVGLADDLDRSNGLHTDGDIDRVDEEEAAWHELVCIGSHDWRGRVADDLAGCSPSACNGTEARVRNASGGIGHRSLLHARLRSTP